MEITIVMRQTALWDKKSIRRQSGFTMMEVLVAMVILTIGLAGTATLVAGLIRGNQMSRHVSTAATLVQDKIEAFKNSSYAAITSGTETNINAQGQAGGAYTRTWTVTADQPVTGTKTVTVTVTWPFNGVTKTRTMTTVISQ